MPAPPAADACCRSPKPRKHAITGSLQDANWSSSRYITGTDSQSQRRNVSVAKVTAKYNIMFKLLRLLDILKNHSLRKKDIEQSHFSLNIERCRFLR